VVILDTIADPENLAHLEILREYYANQESLDGFEEIAWTELIKDNRGAISFSIADAMNVYKARMAIAEKGRPNVYLGGRLG
jgi:hypothetical protein